MLVSLALTWAFACREQVEEEGRAHNAPGHPCIEDSAAAPLGCMDERRVPSATHLPCACLRSPRSTSLDREDAGLTAAGLRSAEWE